MILTRREGSRERMKRKGGRRIGKIPMGILNTRMSPGVEGFFFFFKWGGLFIPCHAVLVLSLSPLSCGLKGKALLPDKGLLCVYYTTCILIVQH